ncbi:unnamed protein product [Blepharisma stoltei]|uniref:J domain-containing protein n=1 Tax=Blepharisma stoltei TaxID=1481888 RepID=A0AAU9IUN2_9CILI|nr:unnamed protein product [Blepharisma stoltei]
MDEKRDLYKILSLPQSASKQQIQKAYYKLAIQWHPDKNKSTESPIRYEEISTAYHTLYDNKSRAFYDLFNYPRISLPSAHRAPVKRPLDPLFDFSAADKEENEIWSKLEKVMKGIKSDFSFKSNIKVQKRSENEDVYTAKIENSPISKLEPERTPI